MPAPYKLTWHENTHLCLCRQGASNIHYFFCDFRYSNCPFFLWGGNKDYTPVSYMNSWRICFILLKSNITKVKSVDALNSKQYSWKKSSVRKEKKDNQYAIVMWSRFSLSELWNWKFLLKKKKKKVVVDAMAETSWAFLFLLLFFLLYQNIFLVQQDSPDQVINYLIARLYHHLTIPLL